jgi:hypothetical protein
VCVCVRGVLCSVCVCVCLFEVSSFNLFFHAISPLFITDKLLSSHQSFYFASLAFYITFETKDNLKRKEEKNFPGKISKQHTFFFRQNTIIKDFLRDVKIKDFLR